MQTRGSVHPSRFNRPDRRNRRSELLGAVTIDPTSAFMAVLPITGGKQADAAVPIGRLRLQPTRHRAESCPWPSPRSDRATAVETTCGHRIWAQSRILHRCANPAAISAPNGPHSKYVHPEKDDGDPASARRRRYRRTSATRRARRRASGLRAEPPRQARVTPSRSRTRQLGIMIEQREGDGFEDEGHQPGKRLQPCVGGPFNHHDINTDYGRSH